MLSPAKMATIRGTVGNVWRKLFALGGRYAPLAGVEKEIQRVGVVHFAGDRPLQITEGLHEQGRMAFMQERSPVEDVSGLTVTPLGGGWRDGRMFERFSACEPGLRMLLERRQFTARFPAGYWVQSAHKNTYGDWVSEYLGAICGVEQLDAPLFLPAEFESKPYVTRDLAALGVEPVFVRAPVLIESAKVLRQRKFFVHFDKCDVERLRKVFTKSHAAPKRGGVVYLSRAGEFSEVANRYYPSNVIEQIVEARGGRVIRTVDADSVTYADAAVDAETVIFDHGSAIYNALSWPVKNTIEIVSDSWWNNSFLMLANAMGVERPMLIRGDAGETHVAQTLTTALDQMTAT